MKQVAQMWKGVSFFGVLRLTIAIKVWIVEDKNVLVYKSCVMKCVCFMKLCMDDMLRSMILYFVELSVFWGAEKEFSDAFYLSFVS